MGNLINWIKGRYYKLKYNIRTKDGAVGIIFLDKSKNKKNIFYDKLDEISKEIKPCYTNYVLVNIISTFGRIAGIALIIVVAIFIIRLSTTTRKIKNNYGYYLSLSACLTLASEFIISILLNFNLFPLVGMSMPFISYGNAGYIINMALVGIILSVWRRNKFIKEEGNSENDKSYKFITYEDGKIILNLK